MAEPSVIWANETLLDRLMISADGQDVGMVDDLELSDGDSPVLTALLSGPTALGMRIGDHLGLWWFSIGRRLRPDDQPYPNRVPVELIDTLEHRGITLRADADQIPTRGMFHWTLDKIIRRIPGNQS
jgi:hypothetical protein